MNKLIILLVLLVSFVTAQAERKRVVLVTDALSGYNFKVRFETKIADALKQFDYRVFIVRETINNQENYNDSNVDQIKRLVSITKELTPDFVFMSWIERKEGRSQSVFGVTTNLEIISGKFFATRPDGELISKWQIDAEGVASGADNAREVALNNLAARVAPLFRDSVTK